MTFNQDRRLAFEELERRRAQPFVPFNIGTGFVVDVGTDARHIESVLRDIAARHPALRATFIPSPKHTGAERSAVLQAYGETNICEPGLHRQIIESQLPVTVLDETAGNHRPVETVAREMFDATFRHPTALLRARLVVDGHGASLLLVVVSHMICDRQSLRILERELRARLLSPICAAPCPSNAAAAWPLDAVSEQAARRNGSFSAAATYWLGRWNEFESAQIYRADIPFALPQLKGPTQMVGHERASIDEPLAAGLKEFARASRLTMFMLSLAGLSVLLRNMLRVERVGIWSNFPNRVTPGSENAIGWFVNSHMLGVDLAAATSVHGLLDQVRRVVSEALEQQHLPLGLLWHMSQRCPERGIRIGLDMIDESVDSSAAQGGLRRVGLPGTGKRMVDLDFEVRIRQQEIVCAVNYSMDLIVPYAARQLLDRFRRMLADILSEGRRERVAVERSV